MENKKLNWKLCYVFESPNDTNNCCLINMEYQARELFIKLLQHNSQLTII